MPTTNHAHSTRAYQSAWVRHAARNGYHVARNAMADAIRAYNAIAPRHGPCATPGECAVSVSSAWASWCRADDGARFAAVMARETRSALARRYADDARTYADSTHHIYIACGQLRDAMAPIAA